MTEKDLLFLLCCLFWLLSTLACSPPDRDGDGSSSLLDCNDALPSVHPGAVEQPYNLVDEDCDGSDLDDLDEDGHAAVLVGGDDCDDLDPLTYPGAPERCDGIANDCSDFPDDADHDGWKAQSCLDPQYWGDCDDLDPTLYPTAPEIPYDGIDQNCYEGDLIDVDQDGEASTAVGGPDCDDHNLAISSAQETFIPGGLFYASRPQTQAPALTTESQLTLAYLPDYCIDKIEVSVATYKRCQAVWRCPVPAALQADPVLLAWYNDPSSLNQPIIGLSVAEAEASCAYQGKQLPTPEQWEKAARGPFCPAEAPHCDPNTPNSNPQRPYPWGNTTPSCLLANHLPAPNTPCIDAAPPALVEVDALPAGASSYGILNLSGNAAEWVRPASVSFQDPALIQSLEVGNSPPLQPAFLRGGGFLSGGDALSIDQQVLLPPRSATPESGVRCVRSLPSAS